MTALVSGAPRADASPPSLRTHRKAPPVKKNDGIAQVSHQVLGLLDAEAVGKNGKFVAAQPGHSVAVGVSS